MISRESVQWGYRLILGREPESEEVIISKMQCIDHRDLSGQLIYSSEFVAKQPSFMPPLNKWVMTEHDFGFKIWVNLADTSISWPIIRNEFERAEVQFVKSTIKSGQSVIDLGANIGFFSLLFSKLVGPHGRVLSFEPMPHLFERANMSISENGIKHCHIHNIAIAREKGTTRLVYAPDSPNWGSAFISLGESIPPDHKGVLVPTAPITDYLKDFAADFVKIDIEGAEYIVIENAISYFSDFKPTILSEIHSDQLLRVSGVTPRVYIELLRSIGYKCLELLPCGSLGKELSGEEEFTVLNVVFLPN
ncbi:MAG: FkbM family methyltransferase [Novosphingobium sp.]